MPTPDAMDIYNYQRIFTLLTQTASVIPRHYMASHAHQLHHLPFFCCRFVGILYINFDFQNETSSRRSFFTKQYSFV